MRDQLKDPYTANESRLIDEATRQRSEIDRLRAELAEAEASRATYAAMWMTDSKAIARVREVAGDYWDWKSGKTLQAAILRTLDGGTE